MAGVDDSKDMFEPSLDIGEGVKMPVFGLGTWQARGEEVYEAVLHALKIGYRHIDTAAVYRNEEEVGRAIKESGVDRTNLFVTTKLSPRDVRADDAVAEKLVQECLDRLGLAYVDLVLVHWPGVSGTEDAEEVKKVRMCTWRGLQNAKAKGLTRAIGVSNFLPKHLDHLCNHPDCTVVPAVNQFELHPLLQQREIQDACKARGITIEGYAPLARADDALFKSDPVQNATKKYNKTPAQIVLRWAVQQNIVTIPKSINPKRIEENAAIFDFELTDDEIKAITSLENNTRTCWDPTTIPN